MSNNKAHLIGQTILWGCFVIASGITVAAQKEFFIVVLLLVTGLMSFFIWDYTRRENQKTDRGEPNDEANLVQR